nr:RNA-directed DNA polymerase, eukaryota, reverse transcriptase zinc-binding domain protein [Tanacetum cinerariifolium]
MLDDDGEFTVKELAKFIEEKIPHTNNGGQETVWNKLVPKKVNIFAWRALKGRLLVHVELDRRDIDLDSVLCPSCNIVVETCDHCLVTCDLAMSVWEKVFNWWKVGSISAFSIDEYFHVVVALTFSPFYLMFGKRLFGLSVTSFGKKKFTCVR